MKLRSSSLKKNRISLNLLVFSLGIYIFNNLSTCVGEELKLTILHTNDVHSRFLETNKYSGACSEKEVVENKCYGGFARLHHKVSEIRRSHKNVIYLSGGDYYQGTIWYTLFKHRVVSHFVNKLNHTALALGNHEFDDNIGGLIPFLDAATFPIISSNINAEKEPKIKNKFKKSVVVEYEGRKVGIIGYTTTETPSISVPGDLEFEDEYESVSKEAEYLYGQGVRILIGVGHAGYDIDLKIAQIPIIDLVVGGHTNTFLFSGEAPDVEVALAEYPTVVTQKNGRKVPVVQAYAFGKYLGFLNLTFNEEGEVTSWSGNPILLDGSIPKDEEMEVELKEWKKNVSESIREEVGKTRVFLNGSSVECRLRECNLGNLIADAMVHTNLKYADELYWSDVSMSILNSGGIRTSIDEISKNGSVTIEDIMTVLPFQNTIDLIEIRGKFLRDAFEFSVSGYDPSGGHIPGKFLQISGIRITYDIRQADGKKVKEILVRCSECRVPVFEPLDDEKVYKVAIPTFLATGGDGYKMLRDNKINHHQSGILDTDMFIEYFKLKSPIIQGKEGRINFYDTENSVCLTSSASTTLKSFLQISYNYSINSSSIITLLLIALSSQFTNLSI